MTYQFPSVDAHLQKPASVISDDTVTPKTRFYKRRGKRVLDIAFLMLVAPVAIPFIVLSACVIMLDGHSPFYCQKRVGKAGLPFRMWKLRTMVHNADALLEAYLAENAEAKHEWETTQKLKRDPRITLVGRILRKTSLDELPQLWNVLNGSMSVVGPRPMMVKQEASYPGVGYYTLQPGITGLWQVSERNEVEFSSRARFDDIYARDMCLKTDLKVIFQTVIVVVRCTGY